MTEPETSLDLAKYAWRLAATLFFVGLNGFFVAAEFALVKVRGSRLDALAEAGSTRAGVARHIYGHMDLYLSACQLGITLASLILGWLAEPAVAELLIATAVSLGWTVDPHDPLLHGVALALALTVVTVLHMTLGEQAPKIWAIHRAEGTSLQVALPLRAFAAVFRPFIWVINEISNGILRAAGLSSKELHEGTHNVDELRGILAASAQAGHITGRQREFAENILGIMDLEVRHILVPRVDVTYLSLQNPLEENLRILRESGHSRFPLCEVGLDTVIGFVHAKAVLNAMAQGEEPNLRKLSRKAIFVSDTQPLSRLILTLQRARSHSAVVLDEHGTAIGLAFLEDALEEIVGPIQDEFDQETPDVLELEPGVYELSGSLALPEAADVLDLSMDDLGDESDTIGGHVVALLGRLPHKDDEVRIGRYQAVVSEVARRRVARLRFQPAEGRQKREPPGGS